MAISNKFGILSNSRELIWTNPNPSATFASQTISLDLSAYDFIIVHAGELSRKSTILVPINSSGTLMSATVGSYYFTVARSVSCTSSAITFDNAYGWGWDDGGSVIRRLSNTYLMPLYIWGIKHIP